MKAKSKERFITIRSEGGLLPVDFLSKVSSLDKEVDGLTPESYHLFEHEKINEAVNRAWDRLMGCWVSFKNVIRDGEEGDHLIRETRERWLLPLFESLGYGRLMASKSIDVEGKQFPISHLWQQTAIHLVGVGVDLDKRSAGVAGAAKSTPHGMVQEFLNRSDDHLWAFVSNGKKLRILRDNVSLTRQAFVEFDLEGIMDGEQFSDFRLLWLLCHQSRVEGERPEECWLEKWSKAALETGIRVRDQLREGVEEALSLLGTGFLQHPDNKDLRESIKSGNMTPTDYYRQLLRVIYRLLFLFVAEDRNLLLTPDASVEARKVYSEFYSTQRIRDLAGVRKGSKHRDLWAAQQLVFRILGTKEGCIDLGLPPLGSFLWSSKAVSGLNDCKITNRVLLDVMRSLAYVEEGRARRAVDFKNLKTEEFGSIYESLLEMHPKLDIVNFRFALVGAGGSERKTTGSYYTPTSLVSCLLDTALEPVLKRAATKTNAPELLLNLKVCDPACGSGHFLIAAAHRVARVLASTRTEDSEPSPEAYRTALRDVISNCIYGVDVNEMSVELCKVSLWLESIEPGKPLSFLDHRIKCGNSLLGSTPALLAKGIEDEAFTPIEGDDRKFAQQVKKENKNQSTLQLSLLGSLDRTESCRELSTVTSEVGAINDSSLEGLLEKENRHKALVESDLYKRERFVADAWCSSFVWKLVPNTATPMTRAVFSQVVADYLNIPENVRSEVERLRDQYKFFHWHVEFPEVFFRGDDAGIHGWSSGFDVVLGNPPWERIKLQEQEWFSVRVPEIAQARTAAIRRKMIKELESTDPTVYLMFLEDKRKAEGESHFIRKSGKFPLCGRGDVNTYSIFAELLRGLISPVGRSGFIVPSGIATDDTTKFFFQDLMNKRSLMSLYDFENRKAIFPGVHRSYKFCLITLTGTGSPAEQGADFVFFALSVDDLNEPDKHFTLSAEDIALLNPNTGTCAIFRSRRDAEITKKIYQRVPVLVKEGPPEENPWGVSFGTMFHMANDSNLFCTMEQLEEAGFVLEGNVFTKPAALKATSASGTGNANADDMPERYLPLYEAKMIHQFDHRWATYENGGARDVTISEKQDPNFVVIPRYWVAERYVEAKLADKWDHRWLLGWRNITNSTNERTVIASFLPRTAVGHSCPYMLLGGVSSILASCLLANLSSLVLDYVTRQKIGGTNLTFGFVNQLPVIPPSAYSRQNLWQEESLSNWISIRVEELINVSSDLAFDVDDFGSVTIKNWDVDRRKKIRAELDAIFFHLYGVERNAVEHILDTFPIVRQKDEKEFDSYRTKELILSCFDEMNLAIEEQKIYLSILVPPPGVSSRVQSRTAR